MATDPLLEKYFPERQRRSRRRRPRRSHSLAARWALEDEEKREESSNQVGPAEPPEPGQKPSGWSQDIAVAAKAPLFAPLKAVGAGAELLAKGTDKLAGYKPGTSMAAFQSATNVTTTPAAMAASALKGSRMFQRGGGAAERDVTEPYRRQLAQNIKDRELGKYLTGETGWGESIAQIGAALPTAGEITLQDWEPETPKGEVGKMLANLAITMGTDVATLAGLPAKWGGGGNLATLKGALLAAKKKQPVQAAARATASALPIAAFGPEIVAGAGQSYRGAQESIREGRYSDAAVQALGGAVLGGVGALGARGLTSDIRSASRLARGRGGLGTPSTMERAKRHAAQNPGQQPLQGISSIAHAARIDRGEDAKALDAREDALALEQLDAREDARVLDRIDAAEDAKSVEALDAREDASALDALDAREEGRLADIGEDARSGRYDAERVRGIDAEEDARAGRPYGPEEPPSGVPGDVLRPGFVDPERGTAAMVGQAARLARQRRLRQLEVEAEGGPAAPEPRVPEAGEVQGPGLGRRPAEDLAAENAAARAEAGKLGEPEPEWFENMEPLSPEERVRLRDLRRRGEDAAAEGFATDEVALTPEEWREYAELDARRMADKTPELRADPDTLETPKERTRRLAHARAGFRRRLDIKRERKGPSRHTGPPSPRFTPEGERMAVIHADAKMRARAGGTFWDHVDPKDITEDFLSREYGVINHPELFDAAKHFGVKINKSLLRAMGGKQKKGGSKEYQRAYDELAKRVLAASQKVQQPKKATPAPKGTPAQADAWRYTIDEFTQRRDLEGRTVKEIPDDEIVEVARAYRSRNLAHDTEPAPTDPVEARAWLEERTKGLADIVRDLAAREDGPRPSYLKTLEAAIDRGEDVPEEVLAQFPELAAREAELTPAQKAGRAVEADTKADTKAERTTRRKAFDDARRELVKRNKRKRAPAGRSLEDFQAEGMDALREATRAYVESGKLPAGAVKALKPLLGKKTLKAFLAEEPGFEGVELHPSEPHRPGQPEVDQRLDDDVDAMLEGAAGQLRASSAGESYLIEGDVPGEYNKRVADKSPAWEYGLGDLSIQKGSSAPDMGKAVAAWIKAGRPKHVADGDFKGAILFRRMREEARAFLAEGDREAQDRGIEAYEGYTERELYRIAEATEQGVTIDDIRTAFKGLNVLSREDGRFNVELPNGRRIIVDPTGDIEIEAGAFRRGYGGVDPATKEALGAYNRIDRGGLIRLAKLKGGPRTLRHESFHAAMDLVLTDKEKAAVQKRYGTGAQGEEAAARAYEVWNGKTPNSIFAKMRAFFVRMVRGMFPNAESVFREIESGKAFQRTTPDTKSQGSGGTRRYADLGKPVFSPVLRAMENLAQLPKGKRMEAGRGDQWLNWITKQAGVKAEELYWTGLDQYLKENAGTKLARTDVEQYLRENQVIVEEVSLGDAAKRAMDDESLADERELMSLEDAMLTIETRLDDPDMPEAERTQLLEQRVALGAEHRQRDAQMQARFESAGEAQYAGSDLRLPGGENYRELLLKLPDSATMKVIHAAKSLDEAEQIVEKLKRAAQQSKAPELQGVKYDWRPSQDRMGAYEVLQYRPGSRREFRGTHFAEWGNVLAHVRMNERIVDGKRVLFIEEIQSDWHQKGRNLRKRAIRQLKKARGLTTEEAAAEVPVDFGYGDAGTLGRDVLESKVRALGLDPDLASAASIREAGGGDGLARDWLNGVILDRGKVPDAPLKTTWHELAMRRIARMAAEEGFDAVGWTDGATQIDRYNSQIRMNVDEIKWSPGDDPGFVEIDALQRGKSKFTHQIPLEGEIEIGDGPNGLGLVDLEEVVGKKIAEQIRETRRGSVSGDDLSIGGEGMKGFYDKMLPTYAKKWGGRKALGKAQVGLMELQTGEKEFTPDLTGMPGDYLQGVEGAIRYAETMVDPDSGYTMSDALRDVADSWRENADPRSEDIAMHLDTIADDWVGADDTPRMTPAHFMEITPTMRETVLREGVPMFQARDAGRAVMVDELRALEKELKRRPRQSSLGEDAARKPQLERRIKELRAKLSGGAGPIERTKAGAQVTLRDTLDASLNRPLKGGAGEAEGPLFTQERDRAAKREAESQKSLFPDEEPTGETKYAVQAKKTREGFEAEGLGVDDKAELQRRLLDIEYELENVGRFREMEFTRADDLRERQALRKEQAAVERQLKRMGVTDYLHLGEYRESQGEPKYSVRPRSAQRPLPLIDVDRARLLGGRKPRKGRARLPKRETYETKGPRMPRPEGKPTLGEQEAARSSLESKEPVRSTGKPPKERFNLDRMAIDQESKEAMVRALDTMDESLAGVQGKKTFAQMKIGGKNILEILPDDQLEGVARQAGGGGPEFVHAIRTRTLELFKDMQATHEDLKAKLKQFKDAGGKDDLEATNLTAEQANLANAARRAEVDLGKSMAHYANMVSAAKGHQAEAARSLAAYRIFAEPRSPQQIAAQKHIKGVLTPGALDELRAVLDKNPEEFSDALIKKIKISNTRMLLELWKAGLLTGMSTHAANISGNIVKQAVTLGEVAIGSGIEKILATAQGRAPSRRAGEFGASLTGLRKSLKPGWTHFIKGMKSESYNRAGFKGDQAVPQIPGAAGRFFRLPFRALRAADNFFVTLAEGQEVERQFLREAHKNVPKGEDVHDFAAKLSDRWDSMSETERQTNYPEMYEAVKNKGLEETFQDRGTDEEVISKMADHIGMLAQKAPIFEVVFPFKRTPARIAAATLDRVPLAPLLSPKTWKMWNAYKRGTLKDPGELADLLAKQTMGLTIMGGALTLASQGGMTGGGPGEDYKLKQQMRDAGWEPYSFTWMGSDGKQKYLSYDRFEPISALLGIAADVWEARDERTAGGLMKKGLASVVQNITGKTFQKGMLDLAKILDRPDESKYILEGIVASVVPTVVAKAAHALDPTVRDTRDETFLGGSLKRLQSRVPVWASRLPPRHTSTGEVRTRGGTAVERFAAPYRRVEAREGMDVSRELSGLEYAPPEPATYLTERRQKVMLEPEETAIMAEQARKATDYVEARVIKSRRYQSMTHEQKTDALKTIFSKYRERARGRIRRRSGYRKRVREQLARP